MAEDFLWKRLGKFQIKEKEEYFDQAFSRNIGLLTREEQKKLRSARVAIPGMGGVGGVHLMTLTRTGIGKFNLADFDRFEPVNINRQFGAKLSSFGLPKLEVMKEEALLVNPFLNLNLFDRGIDEENIDEFLKDVDLVIDSLDFFNFDTRRLLFKKAAQKGIYVVTAGPMGFSSAMLVFSPEGMGFDEYFNIKDEMQINDKYLSFAIGLAPRPTHIKYMNMKNVDLNSKAGPSLNIACQLCSGMASAQAVKILLKKGKIRPVPCYVQYDPFLEKFCKGRLLMGNKNPVQKLKIYIVKKMISRNKPVLFQEIPEKPEPDDTNILSEDIMNYILKAGIQAPSGDNCQPWKFSWDENRADIFLNREKDKSFFNIEQKASIISCGAAAENMKTASSVFGLGAKIDFKNNMENDLAASVYFSFKNEPPDPLADCIWKRYTNRKPYTRKSVPSGILEEIRSEVSLIPGSKIAFLTETKDLKKLGKIIFKADKIRSENRSLHEHLMKMIRFTDDEAIEKKDGFHIKNLEAGAAGELFLKATKSWNVMNLLNKAGASNIVARNSYKGIINSSGSALVYADGTSEKDFFNGGRALERAWLKITSLGMVMQPMTAAALFFTRMKTEKFNEFSFIHRKVVKSVYEDYKTLFPDIDFDSCGQIMLLRFGYGEDIKYKTLRKNFSF